jgi:hypothetical protein
LTGKICFIISPIGSKEDGTWTHWDKVRRHLINEVVTKKGYEPIRADDISKPGIITSQIIEYLLTSELVIADLSEKNANVFYELAIRDAARLPVILIGDKNLEIPFDVRQQRMIKYSLDPDDLEKAIEKLSKFIDSIENEPYKPDSPVTEAILRPTDKISTTTEEYLKLILDKLSNIGIEIREEKIERKPLGRQIRYTEQMPIFIISPEKGPPGTKVTISGYLGIPYAVAELIFAAPGTFRWDIKTDSSSKFLISWVIPKIKSGKYDFIVKFYDIEIISSFEII